MGDTESAFLRIWTEKEAIAKRRGARLTDPTLPDGEGYLQSFVLRWGEEAYYLTLSADRPPDGLSLDLPDGMTWEPLGNMEQAE
jgi:hypothetical protein